MRMQDLQKNDSIRPPENEQLSYIDAGVVVAENIRLLVFLPLFVGCVAFGATFLIAPTFTARTSFLPPQQQQNSAATLLAQLGSFSGLAASSAGFKNPLDQYGVLTKSVVVADRIVDRFRLKEHYDEKLRVDARKVLARNSKIVWGKEGLLVVEVDDNSPQMAADIANAYVSELRSLLGTLAMTEAQQRRAFFAAQLDQTKIRLTAAELALNAIGVSAGTVKADPKAAVEEVARLGAQVTAQEVKLASMRGYLSETAPEFRQAQLALAALRTQLQKSEIGGSNKPSAGGYIEKYRDFKYQEALFELFARQLEVAKIDEAREGALIQVVDVASAPERKAKPARAFIAAMATLASAIIFLAWVFARSMFAGNSVSAVAKLALIQDGLRRLYSHKRA